MRRALAVICLAVTGCYDFKGALSTCVTAGRCPDLDGGAGGGGAQGGGAQGGGAQGGGAQGGGGQLPGVPRYCSEAGICWEHPLPAGNTLQSVWVHRPDDWWAAGTRGTLLHFDGATLRVDRPSAATPELNDYVSMWGTSAGDLLVTFNGDHSLYRHRAGAGWEPVLINNGMARLSGPVISGDEDAGVVWIVADEGVFSGEPLGNNFNATTSLAVGTPLAAAGATAGGLFVTVNPNSNTAPYLFFVDAGASFSGLTVADEITLWTVIRHSSGALWVGGANSTGSFVATQLDGGWATLSWRCQSMADVRALQEVDNGSVLVLCGTGEVEQVSPGLSSSPDRSGAGLEPGFQAMGGVGGYVVAAGQGNISVRRGSPSWSPLVSGDYRSVLRAVFTQGVGAAVGTSSLIMVRDGGEWLPRDESTLNADLYGVGVRNGEIIVGGADDLYRALPSGVTALGCPQPQFDRYLDLAVLGDDLWAVTADGGIFRQNGSSCTLETSTGTPLTRIAATSASRVWAVGPTGAVWRRNDDAGWQFVDAGNQSFVDLALSPTQVYALTASGDILRLSPAGLVTPSCSASCVSALAVSTGADGGDVLYTAGGGTTGDPHLCAYIPGSSCVEMTVPSDSDLNSLAVEGDRLWLFGVNSSVLSWPHP